MGARLVDLSHVVSHGMVTFKGLPGPVISDYLSTQLPPRENTLVKEILNQPGAQIPRKYLRRDRETVLDLFRLGILSLTADLGPLVRLPRRD